MGKRAAASAKTAGRPAKRAAAVAAKSAFEPFDDLRGFFEKDESLCFALPHALKTPASERHAFQKEVVAAGQRLLADLEDTANRALGAAEAAAKATEGEKAKLEEDLNAARALEATLATEKDAKIAEADMRQQEVDEAATGVEAALARRAELEAEKATTQQVLSDFQAGLEDLWAPLKDSTLPPAQWRERNKKVVALLRLLDGCVPESLSAALESSLKLKADTRGSFAKMAIDQAETAYRARMASLQEELSSADARVAAQDAAVATAKEEQSAAVTKADAASEASVAAQNAWVDQTSLTKGLATDLDRFGDVEAQRAAAVEKAKGAVEAAKGGVEQFRSLAEEPSVAPVEGKVMDTVAEAEAVAAE